MRYFYYIFISLLITISSISQNITSSDCINAINVCSNSGYVIIPGGASGEGSVADIPLPGAVNSAPCLNYVGGTNTGAERNSAWILINAERSGTLEFVLGGPSSTNPQTDIVDWAIWNYSSTTCSNIMSGSAPPIYCCRSNPVGGTGCSPNHTSDPTNYRAPITNVKCGDKFLLLINMYNQPGSTTLSFDFSGSTSSISCTPQTNPFSVSSPTACLGSSTPIAITSGEPSNTYVWTPGNYTGSSITVPAASGIYTVVATSTLCGTSTRTTAITVTGPTPTFSVANGTAGGSSDATPSEQCVQNNAFVFTNTGTTGGIHSWDFGSPSASPMVASTEGPHTVSYSSPGTYVVTHTIDDGSCIASYTTTVKVTSPPNLNLTTADASCGGTNGSASAVVTSGTPGFTYLWSPGSQTGTSINSLSVGDYTIMVTDANGCKDTAVATINNGGSVSANISPSANQCLNGNSFSFTNTGTSGTGVNHTWSFSSGTPNSSTSENPTGITYALAGTHTIIHTVTLGSCTDTKTITVDVYPPPVSMALTPTNATCGQNNGAIDINSVTGGTPNYNYFLNGSGPTTNTVYTGLASQNYTVTVQDNNNCTYSQTLTLTNSIAPTAVNSITVATACGAADGSFTINGVVNGTPSYTIMANGNTYVVPPYPITVSNLTAGTYPITVTDANGCVFSTGITIEEINGISGVNTTFTPSRCDANTGTIDVGVVTGGTPTYSFSIDNETTYQTYTSGSSLSYTNLAPGTYTLIVIDAGASCKFTTQITIPTFLSPTSIGFSSTNLSCGLINGKINIQSITGGQAPYQIFVNTIQTSFTSPPFDTIGVAAGTYTLDVKDANGCTYRDSVLVGDNGSPMLTVTPTDILCFGGSTGNIVAVPAGGTPGYTVTIASGTLTTSNSTNYTFTGLSLGNYQVTVIDAANCAVTYTADINQPDLLTATTTHTNATCFGKSDGKILVHAIGGTQPYQFAVNSTSTSSFQTDSLLLGLPAGNQIVYVKDANSCLLSTPLSVSIGQPSDIIYTTATRQAICAAPNGAASINATGGTPFTIGQPYNYAWSSPGAPNNDTLNNVVSSIYTVTVTDANGCPKSAQINISATAGRDAIITNKVNVLCFGATTGAIELTMDAPSSSIYTYQWIPQPVGSQTLTPQNNRSVLSQIPAGTYTVIATDIYQCKSVAVETILEPTQLLIALSSSSVTCFNGNNGTVQSFASGGVAINGAYNYSWIGGNINTTSSSAIGLISDIYSCTIIDANGCSATSTVQITQPSPITFTTSSTNSTCGLSNGSAVVTASGGNTGAYSYTWQHDNSTNQTLLNAYAGSYTVTIKDAQNCSKTALVSISDFSAPTSTIVTQNNVSCNAGANGSAEVAASGGTGASTYTYTWSNGQNTPIATNLPAGFHSVSIQDANGCITNQQVEILQPTAIQSNIVETSTKCFGYTDATATVYAFGGTQPYTYLWTTPPSAQTTSVAVGLSAGSYYVVVTDANGCTLKDTAIISNPSLMTIAVVPTPAKCKGQCDGIALASVSNAFGTPSIAWSDPNNQSGQLAQNLCAGSYTATAVDQNGCVAITSFSVSEPPLLTYTVLNKSNVTCYNKCDGFIEIQPSGGTAPYNYSWSNGETTALIDSVCNGSYNITVTDNFMCEATGQITITQPQVLQASIVSTDATCYGMCDATASVLYSGGTGATGSYSALWLPSAQTGFNINGLCAGTHTVIVKDSNQCEVIATKTINQPGLLDIVMTSNNNSTCGQPNGSACIQVIGGFGQKTINWNTGNTSLCNYNLAANVYTVTVTDANTCSVTELININDITAPTISVLDTTDITCFGLSNGKVVTNITGGSPGYTILWTPSNENTTTADSLQVGFNTIKVVDAVGCQSSKTIEIKEPAKIITAIATPTNITCNGSANGSLQIIAAGGTPTYTYLWNDPFAQTNATTSGLTVGTHVCLVTDANGCTKKDSALIQEPQPLNTFANITQVSCYQGNDGQISTVTSGGNLPYNYAWQPSLSNTSVLTNLTASQYTLTIVDNKGCSKTVAYNISQPSDFIITKNITNATCGQADGSAYITAGGSNGGFQYVWNTSPTQTGQTMSNVVANLWSCTITDSKGCIKIEPVQVLNEGGPVIDSIPYTMPSCFGGFDGTATAYVSGGESPITYLWSPSNQVGFSALGLPAGTHQVLVTDRNGCVANGAVTVTQPFPVALSVSTNTTICYGQSTQIYASGSGGTPSYIYSWSLAGSGLMNSGPHTVSPTTTSSYNVVMADSKGCTTNNSVITITVLPPLAVTIPTYTACDKDTVTIVPIVSGGNGGPYTYLWSNATTLVNNTIVANYIQNPMTYTLNLGDGCTTPIQGTTTVIVNPLPNITVSADKTQGCEDLAVTFTSNSTSSSDVFVWDFGDGGSATGISPQHTYQDSGKYTVTLTVTNSFGCVKDTVKQDYIEVYPLPVADFTANTFHTTILYPTIDFVDQSNVGDVYYWDFNDPESGIFNTSSFQNPSHDFEKTGTYDVILTVTTNKGCQDYVIKQIVVDPDHIVYIPNAFTPDGNGINDVFYVSGIGIDINQFKMEIYDRWGELIYQTDNVYKGWNGITFNGTKPVQQGVYIYKVYTQDLRGEKRNYIGHVTLLLGTGK